MNNRKSFILALLVGIVMIAFAALSIAQTTSQQSDQKKQVESCCAMDSCCCHNGSCAMKTGEQSDAAEPGCCGDSCKMKMNQDAKHHSSDAGCCCSGDLCQTMTQDDAKTDSPKQSCCAAHAQNGMTAKHDMAGMKKHDAKKHDMKNGCCCCGDSCEMKPKQTGF